MASISSDEMQKFNQEFKELLETSQKKVEEIAKTPSPEASTFKPCRLTITPANTNITELFPVPSPLDCAKVVPVIFELKTKLAQLESDFLQGESVAMSQKVESLLADLSTENFDQALNVLDQVHQLLNPKSHLIFVYKPQLTRARVDQLIRLVAKQFRIFLTTHIKLDKSDKSDRQRFLNLLANITTDLFHSPLKFTNDYFSRESLTELMHSLLPYLIWHKQVESYFELRYEIHIYSIIRLIKFNMLQLDGHYYQDALFRGMVEPLSSDQFDPTALLVVMLRMLRDSLTEQAYNPKPDTDQVTLTIEVLTKLIKKYCIIVADSAQLAELFYEFYAIFELYGDISTYGVDIKMQPMDEVKSLLVAYFKLLGADTCWEKHFSLVSNPGRPDDLVPMYRYLAAQGFARPRPDEGKVETLAESKAHEDIAAKPAEESVEYMSEPKEFVGGSVAETETPKPATIESAPEAKDTSFEVVDSDALIDVSTVEVQQPKKQASDSMDKTEILKMVLQIQADMDKSKDMIMSLLKKMAEQK